ncbi:MAG TPA: sugar phosphate nucleotidyltransferase [Burkholderiales bacterium]|nr:sugar phosphate nucleotidyltransferase [Burkholderiales bacterium]
MKVVLFCGGLGTRLREHSDTIPKPLVSIGYRPIIWYLMRYYAHFGHKDFILCLGYRGDLIKEYFVNYAEWMSNDFILSNGCRTIEPIESDVQDWRITFVETGLHSNIGERLLSVRKHLKGEEFFFANYSDALTDLSLPEYTKACEEKNVVAGFVAVRTWQSFHAVTARDDGIVSRIGSMRDSGFWLNGGFFRFRRDIFDYIKTGEELVEEPFQRLIEKEQLYSYKHHGFWAAMDTLKDKITFDRMNGKGNTPWKVWEQSRGTIVGG